MKKTTRSEYEVQVLSGENWIGVDSSYNKPDGLKKLEEFKYSPAYKKRSFRLALIETTETVVKEGK